MAEALSQVPRIDSYATRNSGNHLQECYDIGGKLTVQEHDISLRVKIKKHEGDELR
jgi:hypothetical protein